MVAPDEPVELWDLVVTETGGRPRVIWLCPYVEWDLGGYPTFSSKYSYFRSTYDAARRAVLSFNTSNERPHPRYNAFLATDGEVMGWCGSPRQFFGPYGTTTQPEALVRAAMPCAEAWCEDLAGAMAIRVELAPGSGQTVAVALGSFDTEVEKDRLIDKVLPRSYRENAFKALRNDKRDMAGIVRVETPDPRLNVLTNVWLKQQTQLCVEFGRDGARGFRDTLQDAWAAAPFNSRLARAKLTETMRHQHADGHGIRGWMPLQPHHYSDGPVWLAMAVCAYLKETGDFGMLDEVVPFLDGGEATVLEHVLRGLRFLSGDTGSHGLVLAHEGDWNDSLNWLCRHGRGESVWTSMGLYHGLNQVAELATEVLKDAALAGEMRERSGRIGQAVQKHGWDGDWYLAGYNDDGEAVGSHQDTEGRVYLNPQTWAVMTGLATGERLAKCLKAVDEMLESEHGSLTLWPAYTRERANIGRLSVLLPGMYENGTPYCHGTAFKIVADCCAGRGDEAYRSWRKVMPDSPEHPSVVSGCEPYAFTNQYLGPDNGRAGASISGWITGSAGWMFRAVIEYMAGIRPGYHGFTVQPCLPSDWPSMRVNRPLRGRERIVEIRRGPGGYGIRVDGEDARAGTVLPYA
jgi:cellobiose phosphorylase